MNKPCPKGCLRQNWLLDRAVVFVATNAYGQPSYMMGNRVPTPPEIALAYKEMCARLGNFHPPALMFCDDLHGSGGIFNPNRWTITVGVEDITIIVDELLDARWWEIAQITKELMYPRPVTDHDVRKIMIIAGMGRCVAHELGHALIDSGWWNPYAPDEEAGADYYAGKLDASRGKRRRLGELFFRKIGCIGPTCTHPTPQERANAYVDGYETQRAQ